MRRRTARIRLPITLLVAALGVPVVLWVSVVADPLPACSLKFAGPYGESGFLEDYTAWVRGEPIGNVVLVTRNAAGQAQHSVANYRPRSTLKVLSRLISEHFAGTSDGEHFATSGD